MWRRGWIGRMLVMAAITVGAALLPAREARPADRSMYDVPRKLVDTVAARLLGGGVAHEIGHYLLASRSHTTRGLMRPQFSGVEAPISDVTRYELDRGQRRRLEERLGERDRAAIGETRGRTGEREKRDEQKQGEVEKKPKAFSPSPVLLLFLFSLSHVIFPALNRPASPPSR